MNDLRNNLVSIFNTDGKTGNVFASSVIVQSPQVSHNAVRRRTYELSDSGSSVEGVIQFYRPATQATAAIRSTASERRLPGMHWLRTLHSMAVRAAIPSSRAKRCDQPGNHDHQHRYRDARAGTNPEDFRAALQSISIRL